jgi:hypothetical protein
MITETGADLCPPEYEQQQHEGRNNANAPKQDVLHGLTGRRPLWRHGANPRFATLTVLETPDYAKSARALVRRGPSGPGCRTCKSAGVAYAAVRQGPTGIETNADGWPDDVRLSDIEPSFT